MLGLLTTLFLVTCGFATARASDKNSAAACNGDFDFYLLLDTSSSIGNKFATEVIPFVEKLLPAYTHPKLRFTVITFDDIEEVEVQHPPLTSNRTQLQAVIERLKNKTYIGRTHLAPAISEATTLIRRDEQSRVSVLLTVTDGALDDPGQAAAASKTVENLGATIAAIGIGDADRSQLRAIATYPNSLVFINAIPSNLSAFVKRIVGITCIEVKNITVSYCEQEVVMSGRGLNNTIDPTAAVCRFTRNDQSMDEFTTNATPMGYHRLTCPLPSFNDTSNFEGSWTLQFSLNGKTYSTATDSLLISNCSGTAAPTASPTASPLLPYHPWILIICLCCIVIIIGCLLLVLACVFCNRVRRLMKHEASDMTIITVRGRAPKKSLPVTLQITNKIHAGIPKEGTVKVQREEQETHEVAESNCVAVPVKVEKHRKNFGKKSKKMVEAISCSSPPT